jgi:predicted MFS family arabinose efflux permease
MLTRTRQLGTSSLLISLSFFFWGVGEGLWFYIQPLYPERLGATPEQIGLVLAMLNVGHLLAIIPFAMTLKRFNPRTAMLFAYVIGPLSMLMLAIAPGWEFAGLGFFAYGIALAGYIPMNVYLVQAVQSDPTRHPSIGLHTILTFTWASNAVGIIFGPAMGGLLSEWLSIRAIFYVSAFWLGLSLLTAWFCPTFPILEISGRDSDRSTLYQNPRFRSLFVIVGLLFFVGPLGFALYPSYLEGFQGFSTETLGFLGTISAIGVAVVSLWLGHRVAWRGLLYVVLMTLLTFIIFWVTSAPAIVGVGYFLFGGWAALRPVATSLISETVRVDQQSSAFAVLELLEAVGGIGAPLAAGFLYARQAELPVIVAVILTGVTMIVSVWIGSQRNTPGLLTYNDIVHDELR